MYQREMKWKTKGEGIHKQNPINIFTPISTWTSCYYYIHHEMIVYKWSHFIRARKSRFKLIPAIKVRYLYQALFSSDHYKHQRCSALRLPTTYDDLPSNPSHPLRSTHIYETVADVPKSWVWWRADFQSGSRVLKKRCSEPFLIYIYGIQCDFMPKNCWKHSNFENR